MSKNNLCFCKKEKKCHNSLHFVTLAEEFDWYFTVIGYFLV